MVFSGFEWVVIDSQGGAVAPGPNIYSPNNVWVDNEGLHLQIKDNTCAGVTSKECLGEGTYVFKIIGRPDLFNPNVVLGLFPYDLSAPNRAYNEIDIEFSRWGNPNTPIGTYTYWYCDKPDCKEKDFKNVTHQFEMQLGGTHTMHIIEVDRYQVHYKSFHGHEGNYLIHSKQFWNQKAFNETGILTPLFGPLNNYAMMNLWQFKGKPEKDTEIIISEFDFIPR